MKTRLIRGEEISSLGRIVEDSFEDGNFTVLTPEGSLLEIKRAATDGWYEVGDQYVPQNPWLNRLLYPD